MHKKLADDLTSIAHSILRMKNKDDVFALKLKAHEVYEKLALLAYVEEYVNTTPNAEHSKEELLTKITEAEVTKENTIEVENTVVLEKATVVEVPVIEEIEFVDELELKETITEELYIAEEAINEVVIEDENLEESNTELKTDATEVIEQPFDEIQELLFGDSEIEELIVDDTEVVKGQVIEEENTTVFEQPVIEEVSVVEELEFVDEVEVKETITEELYIAEEEIAEVEQASEEPAIIEGKKVLTLEEELGDTISVDVMANLFEKIEPKKTLHDKLQNTITVDLNDRIAFVKHLFNGNQEDFNRVLSQLNTMNSEKSAKNFIQKMIKPDYDWSEKEAYEVRLMELIERKFIV